jgi:membrane protease YdiL (CAAX protease family)
MTESSKGIVTGMGVSKGSARELPAKIGALSLYLLLLGSAELLVTSWAVAAGLWLHSIILLALMVHATVLDEARGRLYLAVSVLPLIRLLSLGMPLWLSSAQADWFAMINLPLIIATVVAARVLRYRRVDLGLTLGFVPVQVALAASGLAIGYLERKIIQPPGLTETLGFADVLWPAISLLLFTGLSEELLFRGVLQKAAVDNLGRGMGILFVAVLFGIMHIGWESALDVAFVSAVGAFFGYAVYRTRSILGVTFAHGIANILLFIVLPNL